MAQVVYRRLEDLENSFYNNPSSALRESPPSDLSPRFQNWCSLAYRTSSWYREHFCRIGRGSSRPYSGRGTFRSLPMKQEEQHMSSFGQHMGHIMAQNISFLQMWLSLHHTPYVTCRSQLFIWRWYTSYALKALLQDFSTLHLWAKPSSGGLPWAKPVPLPGYEMLVKSTLLAKITFWLCLTRPMSSKMLEPSMHLCCLFSLWQR